MITLKNGTKHEGVYRVRLPRYGISAFKIVGYRNKERYGLKDIEKVVIVDDKKEYLFEVIETKKYVDSKKAKLKFGQVMFIGQHITLYETVETIYSSSTGGGFIIQSTGNYQNSYAKKNGDSYAFNIGYIYGVGQKGIKKRLKAYFRDCPKLVNAVKNGLVEKKDVKTIIRFYENNCGN